MRIESVALAVISGYECLSLITGRVPTVTNLVCRLPKPVYRLVEAAVAVWWTVHLERAVRHFD